MLEGVGPYKSQEVEMWLIVALLACAAEDTNAGPAWDRYSVDVVERRAEADIPAGAVWTVECCNGEGCYSPDGWVRGVDAVVVDCKTHHEWADVVWYEPGS